MMTIPPLKIDGYTGLESDEEIHAKLVALLCDRDPSDPVGKFTDFHYQRYGTARLHNTIAPMVYVYARTVQLAAGKKREADGEFADLGARTTTAWHACHHRFHLATVEARDLLAKLVELATEIRATLPRVNTMTTPKLYEQLVPASHRINLDLLPDPDKAKSDLAEFVELSTTRFAVARVTLTGAVPAGFEPYPPASDETPTAAPATEPAWSSTSRW